MSNLQSYKIDIAIHPGKTLEETLGFLNVSIKQLSEKTGISVKHISNIINEKASITPETSLKLEKSLGVSASFWDNLDKNYHSSLARIKQEKLIKKEFKYLDEYRETYKELSSKGFLPKLVWRKSNYPLIVNHLLNFFGIASFTLLPEINSAAFKRYNNKNINYNTISAIIRIGEKKAETIRTNPYNEVKLKERLQSIKKLSLKNYQEYIPLLEKQLAELGIVLVCIPGFSKTGVQGISKWLSKDKAIIILKTSGQNEKTGFHEDKFWFNLYHEIGHLILHGKKSTFIDLKDEVDTQEEKQANDFATKQLIPGFIKSDLDRYIDKGKISAEKAIEGEANRYGVSKSIIAGQLSYLLSDRQKNVYSILSKYKNMINYNNCSS